MVSDTLSLAHDEGGERLSSIGQIGGLHWNVTLIGLGADTVGLKKIQDDGRLDRKVDVLGYVTDLPRCEEGIQLADYDPNYIASLI